MEAVEVKKGTTLELSVHGLALGGAGVARAGSLVVFVPGAYPGERVEARIVKRRTSFAEGVLERVLAPSPDRVVAPCAHFGVQCGGCGQQDYAYDAQVRAKTAQVKETLERLGGLAGVPVADCVPSARAYRYRNKMEFSFSPTADGSPRLGLRLRDRFDDSFDVEDCRIASELTNAIVRETRAFAVAHRWDAHHARRHTGNVRFLVVRHLPHTNQCAVSLVAVRPDVPAVGEWAARIGALDPAVKSVVLLRNDRAANVAIGDAAEDRVLYGVPTVEERLLGLTFEVTAHSFLQTNSEQAEALYGAVLEEAALTGSERVLDVYCGAGTISLALARHAKEVVGIETVAPAVEDARRNVGLNGIANARFACGDARAVLRAWARAREAEAAGRPAPTPASERARDGKAPEDPAAYVPFSPDVVVLDPPRAGLHERVIERAAELAPSRIVYVSCNPATLARDLAHFAKHGYATVRVRPYDLFPHTPHVECVATLRPAT